MQKGSITSLDSFGSFPPKVHGKKTRPSEAAKKMQPTAPPKSQVTEGMPDEDVENSQEKDETAGPHTHKPQNEVHSKKPAGDETARASLVDHTNKGPSRSSMTLVQSLHRAYEMANDEVSALFPNTDFRIVRLSSHCL